MKYPFTYGHFKIPNLMPIITSISLDQFIRFIDRLHDIVGERRFLKVQEVLFNVLEARSADYNRVAVFSFQITVMIDPPKSNLRQGQVMLLCRIGHNFQRLEILIIPITLPEVGRTRA